MKIEIRNRVIEHPAPNNKYLGVYQKYCVCHFTKKEEKELDRLVGKTICHKDVDLKARIRTDDYYNLYMLLEFPVEKG